MQKYQYLSIVKIGKNIENLFKLYVPVFKKKQPETVLKKNQFPILIISGFHFILFGSFCWLALGETMRHLSSAEYTSVKKKICVFIQVRYAIVIEGTMETYLRSY